MKDVTEYIIYELEKNRSPEPVMTVIGDLNYDYIFKSPPLESGREVIIDDFTKIIAGAAGYFSSGASRLGTDVYLFTILGDDEDGRSLLKDIKDLGIKADGIKLKKGKRSPFTIIFTQMEEKSPRQVATFMGTLKELSIDNLDYEEYLDRSDLVYACNYFIIPRLKDEIRYVFRTAKNKNIITAYDANAGDGWEVDSNLIKLKKSIYPLTDIIFLNERESFYFTKIVDPEKAILSINPDSTSVVTKLGKRGLIIRHKNRIYRISSFPLQGKIKDTVGAGDSFQAAFLYSYLKKFPIEICGLSGAANASSTLMFHGGVMGQLNNKQIVQYIKKYKIIDSGDGNISVKNRFF